MRYSIPFIVSSISLAVATPIFERSTHELAPLVTSAQAAEHEIPDAYIVVFKDHVNESKASEHHSWVAEIQETSSLKKRSQFPILDGVRDIVDEGITGLKHTYNVAGNLLGYAGSFDETTLNEIRKHPDVSIAVYCRHLLRTRD